MSQIQSYGGGGGGGIILGGTNINVVGNTVNLNNTVTLSGNLYAFDITTNTSAATTLTMEDSYLFAGGTDPDVDVGVTTQGAGCFTIDAIPTGSVLQSQWRTCQDYVDTTDATQTILAFINVPVKTMVTVQVTINGWKSTSDHAIGGTLYLSAYRPTAGNVTLIGMIQSNPAKTNGAAATVDFIAQADAGTQTVQILVTGALGETWNWVTTYSYQSTLNP